MNSEFSVRTATMRVSASEYKKEAKKLGEGVTDLNKYVRELNEVGTVYSEISGTVKRLSTKIEEVKKTIHVMGTVLDVVADEYDVTENSATDLVGVATGVGVAGTLGTGKKSGDSGKKNSGSGSKKDKGNGKKKDNKGDSGKKEKEKKKGNGGQNGSSNDAKGYDNWLSAANQVGEIYRKNIPTYCTKTTNGSPSKNGRKAYKLGDVGGKLSNQTVYDDCSSFVYACLIQAGYIKPGGYPPVSGSYLPGGSMEKIMKEAGFEWVPCSKMDSGADIQPGDILVKNGHVEVFNHFDKNGKGYSNGWGSVSTKNPRPIKGTTSNLNTLYTGVWRYKGK